MSWEYSQGRGDRTQWYKYLNQNNETEINKWDMKWEAKIEEFHQRNFFLHGDLHHNPQLVKMKRIRDHRGLMPKWKICGIILLLSLRDHRIRGAQIVRVRRTTTKKQRFSRHKWSVVHVNS